jgi:nucleotide-binding universal stress UspA family protein
VPFPYTKILCPLDFDDNSRHALQHAAALALQSGGLLHLLHVVQINPLVAEGAAGGFAGKELYDAQVEASRRQLEEVAERIAPNVKCVILIELGEPGATIVEAAARIGADLLVMATHGRRRLKRLVLGSVAERVVRESIVPVLVVRSVSGQDPA